MEQARHFLEESNVLADLLADLPEDAFSQPTLFKQWSINDILVHLHFWNRGADLSLVDPQAFATMFEGSYEALKTGNLRAHENAQVTERGRKLYDLWKDYYFDMAERWQAVDPKTRVKWAGPDMSVRSSISARQMEVWAHGQAIFDLLGKERVEDDRIRNIVMLGVNAFGWSHKVHNLEIPDSMPKLELTAPSGEVWEYGEGEPGIRGLASEFCQVVTQTRNIADTGLTVTGPVAIRWMENAQCFAGPPEKPPRPGLRRMA